MFTTKGIRLCFIVMFLAVLTLMVSGCNFYNTENKTMIQDQTPSSNNSNMGGDRDEHGCIGSAGYVWCEKKQKCIRIWEENCYDNSEEQVKFLLAVKMGVVVQDITVNIEQQDEMYIRGRYKNTLKKEIPEKTFLAVKVNEIWIIAYDGTENVDKNQLDDYNFPPEMLKGIENY